MDERGWRPFLYGGLASCTAECGTFPIDTAKTRLQIQGQKTDSAHSKIKYKGMLDVFVKTTRQEGFTALYAGISPALLRQATYGTIKFGTYYSLKQLASNYTSGESIGVNVCCAVTAGALSSALANPTDVLKVRMQVRGTVDAGLVTCFKDIYTQEGVSGLWRGVNPTAQRAAVIAAVELPVYDFCKHNLMQFFGDKVANHFISSFIAGLGSAIASTPIDVIRTRLMNQRKLKKSASIKSHLYKGMLDCFMQTVRNEGLSALYRGFIPAWLRMGPWNIIFFVTYEQLRLVH